MKSVIEIDGSYGEGGGQILRTCLALSCLFLKPFHIFNIRKKRKKPGLMPQHLSAVNIMALISGASVKGAEYGSTELTFYPKNIKPGNYFYDIGTAGSTMLVLQTILPCLIFLKDRSYITLRGGTHVPMSPSYHYIEGVFTKILKRLSIELRLSIESYGFYPEGGGVVRAEVIPSQGIIPLNLIERGEIKRLTGCSCVSNLPLEIAKRQKDSLSNLLRPFRPDITISQVPSNSRGTFIYLEVESENSIAGFTSLGERGKKAEDVGMMAGMEFKRYHESGMALDRHIGDQIVLYLALSSERSILTVEEITEHLVTNLWVMKKFHDFRYSIEGEKGTSGTVVINP